MRRFGWMAAFLIASVSMAVADVGPGKDEVGFLSEDGQYVGSLGIYNTGKWIDNQGVDQGSKLVTEISVGPDQPWKVYETKVWVSTNPVPLDKKGKPVYREFRRTDFATPVADCGFEFDLEDDLGWTWGTRPRTLYVAIKIGLVQLDAYGNVVATEEAWAHAGPDAIPVGTAPWGWYFLYNLAHPRRGHFVDSPVAGLTAVTQTFFGRTDSAGGFNYFPGEQVRLSVGSLILGTTEADDRISPLNLFESSDVSDPRVVNMARLLQSLDADADPQPGITITPAIESCLDVALSSHGLSGLDFSDDALVESVLQATQAACATIAPLQLVSAEDAVENLERSVGSEMARRNVSKTPAMASAKAKLEMMPVLVPATAANEEPVAGGIDYYDENGNFLYNRTTVKPLVALYADQIPETGASDTFAAISRDDGKTWKRTNLSRTADLSSFTLADGQPYYGDTKKPILSVKENYAIAVWQSKFCRGGRPLYSREPVLEDGVTPNPYYADDVWGVGGPQRSHDYTEDGFPEVGELPYYCLWVARGTVDPVTAEISWRKPERLTSGERDVYQIAANGAKNVGFAIVWQEDPDGVRPGEAEGPGAGWSGATTNHKTDIWYSFVKWSDFQAIDETFSPNGDPEHSFDDPEWTTNRPMALVPFSLPMRLTDNDACNTDNLMVELGEDGLPVRDASGNYIPLMDEEGKHAGTHRYCYVQPGLCTAFHSFVNEQGETKHVCVTEDGRLLDGDTGASRPNVSFMPYTKADGTPSAWIAIAYEETKGVGGGTPDHTGELPYGDTTSPDEGKNVIYHSFDFGAPNQASGGFIVNLPARDAAGNLLYLVDEYGQRVLDWQGRPQLAYENARRPRMLVQSAGQAGSSGTVLVMVYKQGEEGKGRPSDIFMRRIKKSAGNPYAAANFVCGAFRTAESGQTVCVEGAQNLSSVTPTEYWYNPDQDADASGEAIKVVKHAQYRANLSDASWTNPYDDARAHRGVLRGNDIYLAYDHTPNWAASRNAHDKYDLYIRRSFDGGATWTADPAGAGEVCHTQIWKDYTDVISEDDAERKDTYEETTCYAPGQYEPGRNMSLLKNNKLTVIEPRLVAPPSTTAGSPYPEDVYNGNVFYVAFGTATNVAMAHGDDDEEAAAVPADLYYTFTRDRGQTYYKRLWDVNPDSDGTYAGEIVERWDYLARGDDAQGEAQIRMSPDGSKFYAVWNQEGPEGSDTWTRRIMPSAFPINLAPVP